LISICHRVYQETNKIVTLTRDFRQLCKWSVSDGHDELGEFASFVVENSPRFSAADFFWIERSTILSMLGTVTSFLIIMIQFRQK
jgi:hypothetical protein